ncbi:unannotated protein [freshwater metagenome]|uniref:Unannotated protein n=1 Tax=freshwater metagenome TaxID=449393 RepID=A0A6J6DIN7_9ZZZZ
MEVLVLTLVETHDFEPTISNHLVGAHVGGCASTSLNSAEDELLVQVTSPEFFANLINDGRLVRVQNANVPVGPRCGLLHPRHPADQVWVIGYRSPGNRKVLQGSGCVNTPVGIRGNLPGAERV